MTLQAKTVLNLIAGAAAGFLAWFLTEWSGWFANIFVPLTQVGPRLRGYGTFLLYGALFGFILGLMLGIVEARLLDSRRQMYTAIAQGAAFGFLGGALGLHLGQWVFSLLVPTETGATSDRPGLFVLEIIAHAFGYAVVGGVVGAVQGLSRRSPAIARQGAFGGLIGGFLGGTFFSTLSGLYFPGQISRLVALVATGALVGFFVGLVQNLLKQAWIRVVVGKNEGKEYLIAKPILTIGRSELSDIGLFGDPAIAPTHAVIESLPDQKRHRLRHVAGRRGGREDPYPPTVVNGQPVTAEQWLADGDTIQIGRRTLLFHEKATRGAPRTAGPAPAAARPPAPAASSPDSTLVGSPLSPPPDIVAQMGSLPEPSPLPAALSRTTLTSESGEAARRGPIGTRLICTTGPYTGQSFALSHAPVTIGRSGDRDIALTADTSVSRSHARVVYSSGRHVVSDDGSSNGTFVNGERVVIGQTLVPGDRIQLGETTLRYE